MANLYSKFVYQNGSRLPIDTLHRYFRHADNFEDALKILVSNSCEYESDALALACLEHEFNVAHLWKHTNN
jgi:hypothetical protein